jgi:hypothetical protein
MSRAQFILISAAALVVAGALSWRSREGESIPAEEAAARAGRGTQVPRPALRPVPPGPTWPRHARSPLPPPLTAESPTTQAAAAAVAEPEKASQELPPLPGHKQAGASAPAAAAPKERSLARDALALVGADPLAEAVWYDAINDPQRSEHERSDLIEDLNEDGFPDPHHVTPDDLPLIESRILLIERLAPEAMDEVNFEAFAEAYKDLVNMYARASGV